MENDNRVFISGGEYFNGGISLHETAPLTRLTDVKLLKMVFNVMPGMFAVLNGKCCCFTATFVVNVAERRQRNKMKAETPFRHSLAEV